MLGFHIANELNEIILGYIFAKYKIVGFGFITTDISRNCVPHRSSEMCHFVCTNAIPPNFYMSYLNLANNFKPNNLADRIFPLACLP